MINTEQFTDLVYDFWARRFETEVAEFNRTATYIYEDEALNGSEKSVLYRIGAMSILRINKKLLAESGLAETYPCAIKAVDVAGMREALQGRFSVEVAYTLLDWFLDAERHIPHAVPDGSSMRQLDAERDDATLRAFYSATSAHDIEKAEILVDEPDPVIFGLFDNEDRMTAYASHRYWEDLLCDIGVLVHPDFRGQGLGRAVVSVLCDWCIAHEKIPMYRVLDNNRFSLSIPAALGFQMMVRVNALDIQVNQDIINFSKN